MASINIMSTVAIPNVAQLLEILNLTPDVSHLSCFWAMLTLVMSNMAGNMKRKNLFSYPLGKKLRLVNSARPAAIKHNQGLPWRKRNQELRYPNSQEKERRIIVKGSSSVLILPVTAASYQVCNLVNSSMSLSLKELPGIKYCICQIMSMPPKIMLSRCRGGDGIRRREKDNPTAVARIMNTNAPGVSTQFASLTDHTTVHTAPVIKRKDSHPSRGARLENLSEYLDCMAHIILELTKFRNYSQSISYRSIAVDGIPYIFVDLSRTVP